LNPKCARERLLTDVGIGTWAVARDIKASADLKQTSACEARDDTFVLQESRDAFRKNCAEPDRRWSTGGTSS
jgi:hypothetical protein